MKTPADIIIELMNETPEQTEAHRALNKARRESKPMRVKSDRQQAHKDTGMSEGDFL